MEESDTTIQVTPEQLKEAVECYDHLLETDIQAAVKTLAAVPECGLRIAQALAQALKQMDHGKAHEINVVEAAALPAFLIGVLAGKLLAPDAFCTFMDTGERRFPKRGEWYFYIKAKEGFPVYYGPEIALSYEANDYGILQLICP
jgi:hypothetical protein